MLVIAKQPRSGAERRVIEWLRSWTGEYKIPGVAITNCFIAGQEVDLVILTPHTTVVGEVKGLAPEITKGVLVCSPNTRWHVPGFVGDPISVRDKDTTPYDQVREGVFNLKPLAEKITGRAFSSGLVIAVPGRDASVDLKKTATPPRGCDVLLCDTQKPLRAWFHAAHRRHGRRTAWTARTAHALLAALDLGDQVSADDLVTEGFPEQPAPAAARPVIAKLPPAEALTPPTTPPVRIPPSPVPGPTRPPSRPAPPLQIPTATHTPRPGGRRPTTMPRAAGRTKPRSGGYQTAAAIALIAGIGAAWWFLSQSAGEDPTPASDHQQISTVTSQSPPPAVPPQPKAVPVPPPPAPAPQHDGCFPFELHC